MKWMSLDKLIQLYSTLTGGCLVICETKKFMAMSSQFMNSSTLSLIACGITRE